MSQPQRNLEDMKGAFARDKNRKPWTGLGALSLIYHVVRNQVEVLQKFANLVVGTLGQPS